MPRVRIQNKRKYNLITTGIEKTPRHPSLCQLFNHFCISVDFTILTETEKNMHKRNQIHLYNFFSYYTYLRIYFDEPKLKIVTETADTWLVIILRVRFKREVSTDFIYFFSLLCFKNWAVTIILGKLLYPGRDLAVQFWFEGSRKILLLLLSSRFVRSSCPLFRSFYFSSG